MTKVPGQGGPYYSLTFNHADSERMAALDAILEKPGAQDLISELYGRMHRSAIPGSYLVSIPALKDLLKTQGGQNLIRELHCLMNRRKVDDMAKLFDTRTAGMVFGPKSLMHSFKASVECGQAENCTYHFAMTAIVYAMALEELDPDFFKGMKHMSPQDHEGYEARRQKILAYVRSLVPPPEPASNVQMEPTK